MLIIYKPTDHSLKTIEFQYALFGVMCNIKPQRKISLIMAQYFFLNAEV